MKKIFLSAAFFLFLQNFSNAQCLSQPICPQSPPVFCDLTVNNELLWNDAFFYDPSISSHDLGESPTELTTQIENTCGGDVQASFVLFLDLDNDGVTETAISSAALPGADTIYFGNAANPNYTGGEVRHFDNRPVPVGEKYRFALEKTVQGNTVTLHVRWTTAAAPGTYINLELPMGVHRIEWRFQKDAEIKTCVTNFVVKDCKAPTVVCLNGLSVNITPMQMIQLWATDFLQYAQDNYTPANQLKFAIRRSGTGTGFPVNGQGEPLLSVKFNCADLGTQPVEVWTIDQAGNADYCETYVLVQDNNLNCNGGDPVITACVKNHCDNQGVPGVTININQSGGQLPPYTLSLVTGVDGCVSQPIANDPLSNITITPEKDDNPLQGVNTYDLYLISRHILGLEPLGSPYKMVAADANRSGSITTFDIVELRKLIVGVYQELPNNTSWRFVDGIFQFPNPNNPFQTAFPEIKQYVFNQPTFNNNFIGIKIGDVNCSLLNNTVPPIEELLTIPDLHLEAGAIADVPVAFFESNSYLAFQFALKFDTSKIKVLEVFPGFVNTSVQGIFADRVNTSWLNTSSILAGEPIYTLRVQALATTQLASVFSMANGVLKPEAYPVPDSVVRLSLHYNTVATNEPDAKRQIFAPQPNPTSAGLEIPLRLEESTAVNVEFFDATGRLTYRLEQNCHSGAQTLDIPATALPQPGLYFWRVQVGEAFRTGKTIKQ